jgi:hypothetical protein
MWEKYLNYVRSLPCAICADDTGANAHHEVGNKRGGIAFRSHHLRTMPLCPACHRELHRDPEEFEMRYGVTQAELIVDTLERAVYAGIIVLDLTAIPKLERRVA